MLTVIPLPINPQPKKMKAKEQTQSTYYSLVVGREWVSGSPYQGRYCDFMTLIICSVLFMCTHKDALCPDPKNNNKFSMVSLSWFCLGDFRLSPTSTPRREWNVGYSVLSEQILYNVCDVNINLMMTFSTLKYDSKFVPPRIFPTEFVSSECQR